MELLSGARAGLGRNCCDTRENLEYENLIRKFDEDDKRKIALKHLVTACELLEGLRASLMALSNSDEVAALDKARTDFQDKFPRLFTGLSASKGRLMSEREVQDYDKMAEQRKRRDKKVDAFIERHRARYGEEPAQFIIDAEFDNDPDYRLRVIKKKMAVEIGTFTGWSFFVETAAAKNRFQGIANRLDTILAHFNGAVSKDIFTSTFEVAAREFIACLDEAVALVEKVNSAFGFFAPQNFTDIIKWADTNPLTKLYGEYRISPRALTSVLAEGGGSSVTFPDFKAEIDGRELRVAIAAFKANYGEVLLAQDAPAAA
jgi:hypothetical protein